jgi:hypothetical protein
MGRSDNGVVQRNYVYRPSIKYGGVVKLFEGEKLLISYGK